MISRLIRLQMLLFPGLLLGFMLLFSGCSSDPTLQYMSSIENNQPLKSADLYKEEIDKKDRSQELYLMEKGKIAQLYSDYDASLASFDSQIDIMRQRELNDDTTQGAQINVGSVLVNDNMLPYKARLFEVEMLRLYQAINYMSKGNLEGALIEIRNAEFLMNEAEKVREGADFDDSDIKSFESGVARKAVAGDNSGDGKTNAPAPEVKGSPAVSPELTPEQAAHQTKKNAVAQKTEGEYGKYFDDMVLEKAKSSFLNPYVVCMGGLIHEMSGELNDAYISYKKSLQLMPSNIYLQREVIRLAHNLSQDQDFDWLKSSFPQTWAWNESHRPKPSNGRLVVIYENGWAPRKEQVFISMAAVAVAYPVYRFKWSDPLPLTVSTGNPDAFETYPICYMNALALRALKEEAKWRIIRQTARVLVKGSVFAGGAVMATSGNQYVQAAGIGVMIGSAIYNNASEKADLRSWMTLPESVQLLMAEMPEGKKELKLSCPTISAPMVKPVTIVRGQTTILRVVRVGQRVILQEVWPQSAESADTAKNGGVPAIKK
jgi:hypothetical protein